MITYGETKFTSKQLSKRSNTEISIIDFTKVDKEYDQSQNGVEVTIGKTMHLRSFCIRFYSTITRSSRIFTSNKQFALTIKFQSHLGFILLNEKWHIFSVLNQPPPFSYQHLCFTHNETHYFVACEGMLWFKSQFDLESLPLIKNETRIDKIVFGPGFNPNMFYFNGKVSDLNIFSNYFTEYELINLTKSCSRINKGKKLFDWAEIQKYDFIIPQDLNIEIIEKINDYFCSAKNSLTLGMFPFPMEVERANTVCKAWSGNIFLPESSNDLEQMEYIVTNGGESLKNYTYSKYMCKSTVWLPLYKSEGFDKWVDYNNQSKEVDLRKTFTISNDGLYLQKCAVLDSIGSNIIKDKSCISHYCFFCSWKPYLTFRLRGLCEKSGIDDRYTLTNYFHWDELFRKKIFILNIDSFSFKISLLHSSIIFIWFQPN